MAPVPFSFETSAEQGASSSALAGVSGGPQSFSLRDLFGSWRPCFSVLTGASGGHRLLPFETYSVRGAHAPQFLLEPQVGPSPFPFETGAVRGAPAARFWLEPQVGPGPFPFETGAVQGARAARLWFEPLEGTSPFPLRDLSDRGAPAARVLLEIAMAACA